MIPPPLFPATFFGLAALERLLPGRPQPKVRFWVLKSIVLFGLAGVINNAVPVAVKHALSERSLFRLDGLATPLAVALAFFVSSFTSNVIHRAMHRSTFLWRWFHQMHHSAERVDVMGFAYGHPSELVLGSASSAFVVAMLGVSASAASIAGYMLFVMGIWQHMNIRTPRWLGYLWPRPEQHCIHHQRGVHAYNYGLPVWDMLLGTFRNPEAWGGLSGFYSGASSRIGAMLLGRDVSSPRVPGP